ncbi:hypothetical protein A2U01_0042884 [Trifolium medium]|uniref:Uncharacterized protein n=1 Tax=Trifolium medium TaxID=97028 RepID=A0A392QC42_9FABA|nr:hypothetical protein [Trifolium medium]
MEYDDGGRNSVGESSYFDFGGGRENGFVNGVSDESGGA